MMWYAPPSAFKVLRDSTVRSPPGDRGAQPSGDLRAPSGDYDLGSDPLRRGSHISARHPPGIWLGPSPLLRALLGHVVSLEPSEFEKGSPEDPAKVDRLPAEFTSYVTSDKNTPTFGQLRARGALHFWTQVL